MKFVEQVLIIHFKSAFQASFMDEVLIRDGKYQFQ